MTATVIDRSETVSGLQVLSTTYVQHDANSPPGPVVVTANGLNIAAGATLIVRNNATVNANGLNVNAASTVNVASGGIFNISGPVELGALSNINIGSHGAVVEGSSLGYRSFRRLTSSARARLCSWHRLPRAPCSAPAAPATSLASRRPTRSI